MKTIKIPEVEWQKGFEKLLKTPEKFEYLRPFWKTQVEYSAKYDEMRQNARMQISSGLEDLRDGAIQSAKGTVTAAGALTADLVEGGLATLVTGGLARILPISEVAIDSAVAYAIKRMGVPVKDWHWAVGTAGSFIPVIGDFISPGLVAGVEHAYLGSRKMYSGFGKVGGGIYDLARIEYDTRRNIVN